jgi:RNA polymerase sigma-70 factor (ECF subfamily)
MNTEVFSFRDIFRFLCKFNGTWGLFLDDKSYIDNEYLERYQNGDFSGFDNFYKKNHDLIFHFLLSRLRSKSDAEDAFQETFFRIHRYITSYDPSQPGLTWVFAIARNVVIDSVKRRKNNLNIDSLEIPIEPRTDERLIARETLDQLLKKLKENERSLIEKYFLEDLGFEQIARSLGASNDTIRQRVSRLTRKLRV